MSLLQRLDKWLTKMTGYKPLTESGEHQAIRSELIKHQEVRRQCWGEIGETSGTRWTAADFEPEPKDLKTKDLPKPQ